MKAIVAISTSAGPEILTVNVDHYDPFAVLAVRGTTIQLTRDECRQVADALRAASLREPYEAAPDLRDG
ncbi:MAG: hypothetical protein QOG20_1442 [Pseudonocardiales bacterium]|jgi:hypothetical protein|uniref:hypothetical protein n=1 Tax=Pseudonocardia sp. TaxID=60912 RepID=UPI00262F2A0D|nr:hypothetical protein [Pseudonocardia sp.]MCW2716653.1 hypothetical protein [Pseudonocardia sp.]MDT7614494.1 hypothetical protein [Pseudonocardiales bacterium]MDT7705835.1 hypothetical protein [Pseudonocardiales bacterium]